jgi:MFS family permease
VETATAAGAETPARAAVGAEEPARAAVGAEESDRPTLGAFALPTVRWYVGGQILSNVGTWFQLLALSLLVVELTDSSFALALVPALQQVPVLLLTSHGGLLGDRYDPRRLLIATNGLAAVLALGLAAVTATGAVTVAWVGVAALASGAIHAVDRPVAQLMPSVLVPPNLLSGALGMSSLIQSASRLVGPALAGVAYARYGPAWCFAVNGVSYGAVLLALVAVRGAKARASATTVVADRRERPTVRQGLREAWERPALRRVLVTNAVIGFTAFNFIATITGMVNFTFGEGGTAAGLAHAANAVGAVAGGVVGPAVMARAGRRLDVACAGFALALVACAVAPTLTLFLALGPLLGFALALYQVTVLDAVHRQVDRALLGRALGLVTLGVVGTTPLGSPLIGLVMETTSPRWALGVGAAAAVGCAGWNAAMTARRAAVRA